MPTSVEGPYTATLNVTDANGCPASAAGSIDAYTTLAVFVDANGSCPADGNLQYGFWANIVGGSSDLAYDWVLYGDGTIVTTEPPVGDMTFEGGRAFVSLPGAYYAELTVFDMQTGCVATDSQAAKVYEPLAVKLTLSTASLVCPMDSDEVTFSAEVTGGSGGYVITWDGDQPGDTCLDGTLACLVDGNGFCDTRSITATASDSEALECAVTTSAPGLYGKQTNVTATVN